MIENNHFLTRALFVFSSCSFGSLLQRLTNKQSSGYDCKMNHLIEKEYSAEMDPNAHPWFQVGNTLRKQNKNKHKNKNKKPSRWAGTEPTYPCLKQSALAMHYCQPCLNGSFENKFLRIQNVFFVLAAYRLRLHATPRRVACRLPLGCHCQPQIGWTSKLKP